MNATDSTTSLDSNKNTENVTSSNFPYLKNSTGESHQDSNKHSYFVPAMLMIVLGIIIISTFFDKIFSSPVAMLLPQGQNNGITSNDTQAFDPGAVSGEQAEIATPQNTISVPVSTHDDISTTATAPVSVVNNASQETTATITRTTYAARQGNFAFPYTPQIPHATVADPIHSNYRMMQTRRKAYQHAVQAKIEHRHNLREYRLIVMRRIQQDRKDLHRRKHISRRPKHDDAVNNMDQIQYSIPNHPT